MDSPKDREKINEIERGTRTKALHEHTVYSWIVTRRKAYRNQYIANIGVDLLLAKARAELGSQFRVGRTRHQRQIFNAILRKNKIRQFHPSRQGGAAALRVKAAAPKNMRETGGFREGDTQANQQVIP